MRATVGRQRLCTTLFYELADGRAFEVRRDYTRDAKGVHIYDRDGNDVAADAALGRTISPGDVHLQIPYDAFINASCVLQQSVGIDPERNVSIATHSRAHSTAAPKKTRRSARSSGLKMRAKRTSARRARRSTTRSRAA